MSNDHYLVIGATGKTGKRVTDRLRAARKTVKAASRSGNVIFDWNDKSSWPDVLRNVKAMYVTYFPDLAMPGAQDDIRMLCEIARQQKVSHITLLSGRGESEALACERIVASSGMSWTVVRASWFMQNFTEGLFAQFLLDGSVALPVGDVKEPFVDIDDIADIAFDSLLNDIHKNKLYEVTGPELLSFSDVVEAFNQAYHRKAAFHQVSPSLFSENLTRIGVDENAIAMLHYLFTEVLDGRNANLADGVKLAIGRAPTSFKTFLQKNRHVFA